MKKKNVLLRLKQTFLSTDQLSAPQDLQLKLTSQHGVLISCFLPSFQGQFSFGSIKIMLDQILYVWNKILAFCVVYFTTKSDSSFWLALNPLKRSPHCPHVLFLTLYIQIFVFYAFHAFIVLTFYYFTSLSLIYFYPCTCWLMVFSPIHSRACRFPPHNYTQIFCFIPPQPPFRNTCSTNYSSQIPQFKQSQQCTTLILIHRYTHITHLSTFFPSTCPPLKKTNWT